MKYIKQGTVTIFIYEVRWEKKLFFFEPCSPPLCMVAAQVFKSAWVFKKKALWAIPSEYIFIVRFTS